MKTLMIELEWWDNLTGREQVIAAVRAADGLIVAEAVHVADPHMNDVAAADWGEASIHFTVVAHDGVTPRQIKDAMLTAVPRIKTIAIIPDEMAHCTSGQFYVWDRQQMIAEHGNDYLSFGALP